MRDNARQRGLRRLGTGTLVFAHLLMAHAASPGLTVFASDGAAAGEFVRQLRATQDSGERFELVRVGRGAGAAADSGPASRASTAGTRPRPTADGQRSPPRAPPAAPAVPVHNEAPTPDRLAVAVGPTAAREAIGRAGDETLVLAMLSRMDYDRLKTSPALQRGERRVGVLLREVPVRDQLALIAATLPDKRRLGVVSTPAGEAVLHELREAAQGWDLQVEVAPDANSIGQAVRALLPRSDALIVLPDLIGDDPVASQALLRSAAGAGVPVFGSSEAVVRSGGLAAVVATTEQQAQQVRALGRKLADAPPGVQVETPMPTSVRVNPTVARGLGLHLPSESELDRQVGAQR